MIGPYRVRLRRVNSWPYNDRPAGFSLPDYGLSAEEHERLTDEIWQLLVVGNDDVDDFVEWCADGEEFPLTEEQAREAFELALSARMSQQSRWTEQETTTNLDRAFDELEEAGIIARQDFACCGNCGVSEIGGERDDSRDWLGYIFFHQQDTARLVDSGSLFLFFGLFQPGDVDEFVNAQVLPRLNRHGLNATWNGDPATRIEVETAQWFMPL